MKLMIKNIYLALFLGLALNSSALAMSVQGLTADGVIDSQELVTEHELPRFPAVSDNDVSTWVDWWETYSAQFTPKAYRREVVGNACAAKEEQYPVED